MQNNFDFTGYLMVQLKSVVRIKTILGYNIDFSTFIPGYTIVESSLLWLAGYIGNGVLGIL